MATDPNIKALLDTLKRTGTEFFNALDEKLGEFGNEKVTPPVSDDRSATERWGMSFEDVEAIVARVHYDKQFRVGLMGTGFFIQITYEEPDIRTHEVALQRGRKWYVSKFATESEVVQTCLTAALASAEHQVREHFAYAPHEGAAPRAIYGPHFSAKALYEITGKPENYDARADPE